MPTKVNEIYFSRQIAICLLEISPTTNNLSQSIKIRLDLFFIFIIKYYKSLVCKYLLLPEMRLRRAIRNYFYFLFVVLRPRKITILLYLAWILRKCFTKVYNRIYIYFKRNFSMSLSEHKIFR